jgi:hypothetical protein
LLVAQFPPKFKNRILTMQFWVHHNQKPRLGF